MTNGQDITNALRLKVGLPIEHHSQTIKYITNLEQAMVAGHFIYETVKDAFNLHLEKEDALSLISQYNTLCDKFPEIEKKIHEKF